MVMLILMRANLLAAYSALAAAVFAQPADLVLRNGKIVTMSRAMPEAQAIAIRGGKIVALSSDSGIRKQTGQGTQVIALHGMPAIPGFIAGHGHFTCLG